MRRGVKKSLDWRYGGVGRGLKTGGGGIKRGVKIDGKKRIEYGKK